MVISSKNQIGKVTASSKKKKKSDSTEYYWAVVTSQQYESRTRSIKLAKHLAIKRRRLRSDQTTLLGSEIQMEIMESTLSPCMWHEIQSYTCLVCKKGVFVSPKHNHIRNITASLLTDFVRTLEFSRFCSR